MPLGASPEKMESFIKVSCSVLKITLDDKSCRVESVARSISSNKLKSLYNTTFFLLGFNSKKSSYVPGLGSGLGTGLGLGSGLGLGPGSGSSITLFSLLLSLSLYFFKVSNNS